MRKSYHGGMTGSLPDNARIPPSNDCFNSDLQTDLKNTEQEVPNHYLSKLNTRKLTHHHIFFPRKDLLFATY